MEQYDVVPFVVIITASQFKRDIGGPDIFVKTNIRGKSLDLS